MRKGLFERVKIQQVTFRSLHDKIQSWQEIFITADVYLDYVYAYPSFTPHTPYWPPSASQSAYGASVPTYGRLEVTLLAAYGAKSVRGVFWGEG